MRHGGDVWGDNEGTSANANAATCRVALAQFRVAVVRLTGVSVFVPAPSMMQPTLLLLSAAEGGRVSLTLV